MKEIGSNFWITPEDIESPTKSLFSPAVFNCDGSDYAWLSTGRSAIRLAIETIESRNSKVRKTVCLPGFTCDTVYEPFMQSGYEIVSLPCDRHLRFDKDTFFNIIDKTNPGIILLHKYFGFDSLELDEGDISKLHEKGIIIIEDCTQSLYSDIPRIDADYYIASIRKWCGVPDGAFCVCKEGSLIEKPIDSDVELEKLKTEASISKYEYIVNGMGDKQTFLNQYRVAEALLDSRLEFFKISPLSAKIQSKLDIESLKSKRRSNYESLLKGLKGIVGITPIFGELAREVPLYFPVLCEDRNRIQRTLAESNIFAPIVWPKQDDCPPINEEMQYIYDHILCIPIDQRYSNDDMNRINEILKNNLPIGKWMNWEEILPYRDLIIHWEEEVTIKYHYPDKELPKSFFEEKFDNLKLYLEKGNTFFWGLKDHDELVGYYWGYISEFLFERTWYARSSFLREDMRGKGYGLLAKLAAIEKAKECGCVMMESMYAPFNNAQEKIYKKLGYQISRIEVVKKL